MSQARKQLWIGLIATAVMAVALPLYAARESGRMAEAQVQAREEAVAAAMSLYAENCVLCHGATGEGIGTVPPLDAEGLRGMDYDALFKTIERGRYDTAMAAYGVDEGGMLTDAQIDQLVALVYHGDWGQTGVVVAEMGLTPPLPAASTVSSATLQLVAQLPDGEALANGLSLYAENCVACHGADAGGTALAPALNVEDLRVSRSEQDLARAIAQGVPGTLMAGWDGVLAEKDVADLVTLLQRWDTLPADALPAPSAPPVIAVSDPDVIAWGEQIYDVTCARCHGSDGQGRPIAPALNVQGFLSDTNDLALKTIVAQGVPDTAMPAWGERLSDDELNALVSFIRAWEPTAPAVAEMERGRPGGSGQSQGGPPWMRDGSQSGQSGGQAGSELSTAGDASAQAGGASEGEGGGGTGRQQRTDVLTEVNWRPLLFFGIAAVAGVLLMMILVGNRRQAAQ
jgi:cbb3-type cytochrome c oxidase subunit III